MEKNIMSKTKLNEGLFGAAKKFTDAFFDGLKSNAVNTALERAKKNKSIPPKIVKKMSDIDRASKELEQMLRDIE
jgi:hypothetical protein